MLSEPVMRVARLWGAPNRPISDSFWLVLALVLAAVTTGQPADAQPQAVPSPALQRERLESLQGVLKGDPPEQIAKSRRSCASGQEPTATARSRSLGATSLPDAADYCVTVLLRLARDGELMRYYQALLTELNGRPDGFERFPSAVAATVMKGGSNQVPVGNQRAAVVSAALALDAGFTVAFQKGERHAAGMPPVAALKEIAERCLSLGEGDLGLCYSTGYVYGARAVSGLPLAGG